MNAKSKDPFFDDDVEIDDDPIPDGVWASEAPRQQPGLHEWKLIGSAEKKMEELQKVGQYVDGKFISGLVAPTVPVNIFACSVCGLEVECLAWESPTGSLEEKMETCAEVLIKKTYES